MAIKQVAEVHVQAPGAYLGVSLLKGFCEDPSALLGNSKAAPGKFWHKLSFFSPPKSQVRTKYCGK